MNGPKGLDYCAKRCLELGQQLQGMSYALSNVIRETQSGAAGGQNFSFQAGEAERLRTMINQTLVMVTRLSRHAEELAIGGTAPAQPVGEDS